MKLSRCGVKAQALAMADLTRGDGAALRQQMKSPSDGEIGNSEHDWAQEPPSNQD